MPNGITRESFQQMQDSDKLNVLFDYVSDLTESQDNEEASREASEEKREEQCKQRISDCDARFKKLEWAWAKMAGVAALGALVGTAILHPVVSYLVRVLGS